MHENHCLSSLTATWLYYPKSDNKATSQSQKFYKQFPSFFVHEKEGAKTDKIKTNTERPIFTISLVIK